jgi:hypothetical protein
LAGCIGVPGGVRAGSARGLDSARTRKPATAASAESANVTAVAEAPSIMAETANPITGRAIAGEALGDEARHTVILAG